MSDAYTSLLSRLAAPLRQQLLDGATLETAAAWLDTCPTVEFSLDADRFTSWQRHLDASQLAVVARWCTDAYVLAAVADDSRVGTLDALAKNPHLPLDQVEHLLKRTLAETPAGKLGRRSDRVGGMLVTWARSDRLAQVLALPSARELLSHKQLLNVGHWHEIVNAGSSSQALEILSDEHQAALLPASPVTILYGSDHSDRGEARFTLDAAQTLALILADINFPRAPWQSPLDSRRFATAIAHGHIDLAGAAQLAAQQGTLAAVWSATHNHTRNGRGGVLRHLLSRSGDPTALLDTLAPTFTETLYALADEVRPPEGDDESWTLHLESWSAATLLHAAAQAQPDRLRGSELTTLLSCEITADHDAVAALEAAVQAAVPAGSQPDTSGVPADLSLVAAILLGCGKDLPESLTEAMWRHWGAAAAQLLERTQRNSGERSRQSATTRVLSGLLERDPGACFSLLDGMLRSQDSVLRWSRAGSGWVDAFSVALASGKLDLAQLGGHSTAVAAVISRIMTEDLAAAGNGSDLAAHANLRDTWSQLDLVSLDPALRTELARNAFAALQAAGHLPGADDTDATSSATPNTAPTPSPIALQTLDRLGTQVLCDEANSELLGGLLDDVPSGRLLAALHRRGSFQLTCTQVATLLERPWDSRSYDWGPVGALCTMVNDLGAQNAPSWSHELARTLPVTALLQDRLEGRGRDALANLLQVCLSDAPASQWHTVLQLLDGWDGTVAELTCAAAAL